MPFVLASGSPRRAELLAAANLRPQILPAHGVDETWTDGEDPVEYARRLAQEKAAAVRHRLDHHTVILAADTIVWFDEDRVPLGKPVDRPHAQQILQRLTAGKPHRVTTAFALVDTNGSEVTDVTTSVYMRAVTPDELDRYLDRNEWSDKAGGYAIQSSAASFVTRIEGSYTNVVGLPLAEVVEALQRRGIVGV